jgi:hypothetical protein
VSGEGAHRTLKQTLAWIADRNLDRVNTAYREWRDRYYEYPQLPDWRFKHPLLWDWRSPVGELEGAAQALRQKCENGALRGTGREGASGPRLEIALLRWPDLMLVDIAGVTAGPQLYDSSADPLAIMDGGVKPIFHDVLFGAADLLRTFPAPSEMREVAAPAQPKALTAVEPMGAAGLTLSKLAGKRLSKVEAAAAALLREYPNGRTADDYETMRGKLRNPSVEGAESLSVSDSTLKAALRMLGPDWRIGPH